MDIATLVVGIVGGSGLATAAVTGFWAYLQTRRKTARSAPADQRQADAAFVKAMGDASAALAEAGPALIAHFERELGTMRERFDAANQQMTAQLAGCEEKHDACERKNTELEERVALMEVARQLGPHQIRGR